MPKTFAVVDNLIKGNCVSVSWLLHSSALGAMTTAIHMTAGVLELLTLLFHKYSMALWLVQWFYMGAATIWPPMWLL